MALYLHMVERFCVSSSFYNGISPIGRDPLSSLNLAPITSQRPHLQIPSHWKLGPQHMSLLGAINIQSITLMRKTLSQLRIEGNLLNLIKIILQKPLRLTLHLMVQYWMLSPENKNKARMPSTLSTLFHHGTRSPNSTNMQEKERHTD